ncbi:MAG: pilus assembly protein PilB [Phycisphaerales bacterium]|nr:pilus assembly protein PilB [Phycisphaerales bacterium]
MKGRRLGRVLTKMGKVTREQVHAALSKQPSLKKKLGEVLVEMGLVTPRDIAVAVAGQAGMRFVEVSINSISEDVLAAIPPETANTYQIVPVAFDPGSKSVTVALKSPDNYRAVDDLKLLMGFRVSAVVAPPEQIDEIIKKRYSGAPSGTSALSALYADSSSQSDALKALEGRGDSIDLASLESAADDNQVVRLLNLVLLQAIRDRASDIHLEPFEDEFKMRCRVDGVLYELTPPPKHLALAIVSRVKVMSNLNIAERRLPQDGRINLVVNQQPVDLRVAVLPTMFGESVVMRVLDRSNVQLSLERVGLRPDDLAKLRALIARPNGIVIVTGPTGSGKTTTLYAALNELNTVDTKILTAEDPVEYDIDGMIQCQINLDQELTFSKLLRSFLRQDPDIILVGEVRDLETAQLAIQASLTGHLVFTTLHTNDAPSSVLRLIDLGIESFLLTATVEGIVAQRLVRKICVGCREEFSPTQEQLMELALRQQDVQGKKFFRGRGCEKCNKSGYKGRMGIYEIMAFDDQIREMIMQEAATSALRAEARRRGMRTLRESGLLSIFEGLTTIDEVVRETIVED